MALQNNIVFDNGVELDNAYIKITKMIFIYTGPDSVTIQVSIFRNVAAYSANKPEVEKLEYQCSDPDYSTYFSNEKFTTNDPQTLGYDYLKTKELFSGAISV